MSYRASVTFNGRRIRLTAASREELAVRVDTVRRLRRDLAAGLVAQKHPAVVLTVHWPTEPGVTLIPHAIVEGDAIDLDSLRRHNEFDQEVLLGMARGARPYFAFARRPRIRRDCEECVPLDAVGARYGSGSK